MRNFTIGIVLCFLVLATSAFAEETNVGDVVVTATKTQQKVSDSPATVNVVTGAAIKESNSHFVDEAIRALPGLFSERVEGVSGISDSFAPIHLRGMPNASESLVLLDGQPMNNYEGNIHWWSIPVENIDRIEVVRGPFSALYGGGAMGGVVNILTKTEYSPFEFTYGYGSNQAQYLSAGHGWSVGNFTYNILYRRMTLEAPKQTSTAFSPGVNNIAAPNATGGTTYIQGYTTEDTTNEALTTGITWDMTPDSSLSFRFTHASFELDPVATVNYDGQYLSSSYREHANNTYILSYRNSEIKDVEVLCNAGFTDNYTDQFIWNNNSGDSLRPNSHINAGIQSNIKLPARNTLTVGTDWSHARISSLDEKNPSVLDDDQITKGSTTTTGAYLQDQWDATSFLTLYGGLRYDYWKAYNAATNGASAGYPTETPDHSDNYLSPRVSLVIKPDDKTTIRTSAGEAFRGPTLWEAFEYSRGQRGTSLPNPELKPETIRSYEVGVERSFTKAFSMGATYFNNDIKDMMYKVDTPDLDGDGIADYMYKNVSKGSTWGYEATAKLALRSDLNLFANYTRTYTEVNKVDDPDLAAQIDGKEFTRIPDKTYNIGCDYDNGKLFSNAVLRHVGDRYNKADNSDIYNNRIDGYDPYTVVDFNLGYRVKNCEISAGVFNVFDKEYWESWDKSHGRTYMVKGTVKL
ncbi:MAG TPA: TonB-dependent receptor [Deltaproteobacteria bacterium]|nr:TonB-dependent receptor [Deltaproteobacteria bacterium]